MQNKIPVSVIVVTRNEEKVLARCLHALEPFAEIIVVDSQSTDATADVARSFGAAVVPFSWNGLYPKKRQWCLDTLSLKHERIFFVDADEEVTPELCAEIAALDWMAAGYFVKGTYVLDGEALRFGLKNSKLCLFDRRRIQFPVMDDLDLDGMGEIEGHYQPVLKDGGVIGVLKHALLHHALEDSMRWAVRHEGYAIWQKGMQSRGKMRDIGVVRVAAKNLFQAMPMKPLAAFMHSYVWLGGFLDGRHGFRLALSRYRYYRMVG